MGFRFSLASVLRFRESVERREEIALEKAQLEVARVRRRIEELSEELTRACEKRDRALQQAIPANRLQLMDMEITAVTEARQDLRETLETLRQRRDAQMKLYKAAHSGRQMLTDLEKQQRGLYEQEQVRIQQKLLDDIAATRWRRN